MIVMKDDNKEYLAINIGRPNLLNENDMKRWTSFQHYVKITELRIVVNSVYPVIDGFIQANQYYSGDGHSYTFWLESQNDLNSFVEQLEEIFGNVRPILKDLNPHLNIGEKV